MNTLQETELASWEASFRLAAATDVNAGLADHLRRFDLPAKPKLLLEGTIDIVTAAVAFGVLDGQSMAGCLHAQQYDASRAQNVTYALTFDIFGRSFARVLADARLRTVDLADLYGMPWERHKRVGYERFWISRIDGRDMAAAEIEGLEVLVANDLLFDYGEDEIDFWFDRETYKGAVMVSVQDRYEEDE